MRDQTAVKSNGFGVNLTQVDRYDLAFFRWLHDEYGMEFDIYAFDTGAIDGKRFYGEVGSDRFNRLRTQAGLAAFLLQFLVDLVGKDLDRVIRAIGHHVARIFLPLHSP